MKCVFSLGSSKGLALGLGRQHLPASFWTDLCEVDVSSLIDDKLFTAFKFDRLQTLVVLVTIGLHVLWVFLKFDVQGELDVFLVSFAFTGCLEERLVLLQAETTHPGQQLLMLTSQHPLV
jgi:hypothetical protein